jgi:D-sedoheptulose 7-phosphate isomerase
MHYHPGVGGSDSIERIKGIWQEHILTAQALAPLAPAVADAVDLIAGVLDADGRLFLAGNGGSAADAQHIAAELIGRFFKDRRPMAAIALNANGASSSAIGNDFGHEFVFARELAALGRGGDVLLAISTSGNSPSILRAVEAARQRGMHVLGLTGESGGRLRDSCDLCLCVPSASTPRVQEMHITIGHTICELLEARLC